MVLDLPREVFQLLFKYKDDEESHKAFCSRIITREMYKLDIEFPMAECDNNGRTESNKDRV